MVITAAAACGDLERREIRKVHPRPALRIAFTVSPLDASRPKAFAGLPPAFERSDLVDANT
jgi:hypothetical protein